MAACSDAVAGTVVCNTFQQRDRAVLSALNIIHLGTGDVKSICAEQATAVPGNDSFLSSDGHSNVHISITRTCNISEADCEAQFSRIEAECGLLDVADSTVAHGKIETPQYIFNLTRYGYEASANTPRDADQASTAPGAAIANSTVAASSTTTESLPACTSPYSGDAVCSTRSLRRALEHSASTPMQSNNTSHLVRRHYLSSMTTLCTDQVTWPVSQVSVHLDDGSTKFYLRRICSVTAEQCMGQWYHMLDTCGLDDPYKGSANAGRIKTEDYTYDMFRYVVDQD